MKRFTLALLAALFSFSPAAWLPEALADPPAQEPAAQEPAAQKPAAQKPAAQEGAAQEGAAQEPAAGDSELYVRISETEAGKPKALETAIVQYTAPEDHPHAGLQVDLVGVIHVGEREYYADLKQRLAKYDVVLFELVAPEGSRIRPEDVHASRSPVGALQMGMRDMLNLEFQLEHIDYEAENFRHADMTPEQFTEDMASRGDSVLKMVFRMMGAGLASQSGTGTDGAMLMALLSPDRPKRMKQVMARQLQQVEAVTAGLNDAQGENTLIRGRNARAFEVLREEIEAGKKSIAVFYGAGHLADMAERLERDFSLRRGDSEWLPAWDLQRN